MSVEFTQLFSPLSIGGMTVKNRIASSPHGSGLMDLFTSLPGDKANAYWECLAKGGIGLLIVEGMATHYSMRSNPFQHPDAGARLRRTADVIHSHGTKIVAQLLHTGAQEPVPRMGAKIWAPSAIPSPKGWTTPHEMTTDEVREVIDSFAFAASVVREAGWDGVELHATHGYLIQQFMSPFFNQRTDEYGGSLENRMRFPLEIISAVRQAVGTDFTVGMRISGDEFTDGGYTLDDMLSMAPALAEPGRVDYLSISAGTYWSPALALDSMYGPLNSFVYLAAAIKEVADVPVLARGRIIDPVQAEEIITSGHADMVAMCRGLIADPEFANKAKEGRKEDIRPCIGCNEGCIARVLYWMAPLSCTMNPVVGRETRAGWGELEPADTKKKVMVIGGGPAGLETARVASLRGHKVSLYERDSALGGQTLVAARAPGRESFLDLARYYSRQMEILGVDVHMETEVTADVVKAEAPDAVVVATGSVPLIPSIPGIEQDNVVEARDVLLGKAATGPNVVVFAGEHHIQALSVADLLATQGKKVELLCREYHAGHQVESITRLAIYQRLLRQGVVLTPCTGLRAISGDTVVTVNTVTGEERVIEGVDTLVLACGGRENNKLLLSLKGQVKELHAVGDCAGVRRLSEATMDGAKVGRIL